MGNIWHWRWPKPVVMTSTRWRANAQKSDGTGAMLYGLYMAMSGTTTSTLTIADGAALINGYTYETNGVSHDYHVGTQWHLRGCDYRQ
jgi:L-asparaginase/Glu-tRNA(Gln) amidotransferase subunit D